MNQDDVLFLEVLAEYLKNEMDAILKMIELYRRSQPIEDHYYFNKKFLLSSIVNNCTTEHNAQILNEMKSKFVSVHFLINRGGLKWGRLLTSFFSLSLFEKFTSFKIASYGFTQYLLWGLKNCPPPSI